MVGNLTCYLIDNSTYQAGHFKEPATPTNDSTTSNSNTTSTIQTSVSAFLYVTTGFGVFGVALNTFMVIALSYKSDVKKATSILLLSAQVSNALTSASLAVDYAIKSTLRAPFVGYEDLMLCKWFDANTLYATARRTVTAVLIGITAERYFKIVHPMVHRAHWRPWMLVAAVAFPWLFGCLTTIPPFYFTSGVASDGNCQQRAFWPSPALDIFYALFLLVGTDYLLPLAFCSYAYARILKSLRFKSAVVTSYDDHRVIGHAQQEPSQSGRSQRKIIKAMIIVVGCFAVFNGPIVAYIFVNDVIGVKMDPGGDFLSLAVLCCNLNLCIDPIVYAFQLDAVRGFVRRVSARCLGTTATVAPEDSSRY